EGYHARWDTRNGNVKHGEEVWRAEIPLLVRGQRAGRLECTGHRNGSGVGETVARVAELAQEVERVLSCLVPTSSTPRAASNAPVREDRSLPPNLVTQRAEG